MNRLHTILLVMTMLTLPITLAEINILSVNHPTRNVQGGTIPFYTIITNTNSATPDVTITITNPQNKTETRTLYATNNKDEYTINYFNTETSGTYQWTITAIKGTDKDSTTGNFTIADFKIDNVDFVNVVKKVQSVDTVSKLTNQTRIYVAGTDYQVFDNGTTFIQLLEGETPINNATCYSTIYYPDKTTWINNQLMTYQPNSNGFYYYDFTAPNITGIYMISVMCLYETTQTYYPAQTITIINATYVSGNNASINNSDDNKYVVMESGNSNTPYSTLMYLKFDETNGTKAYDSAKYNINATYINSPELNCNGTQNTAACFNTTTPRQYVFVNFTGITTQMSLNATEDMAFCFGINTSLDVKNTERVFDFLGSNGFSIRGEDDELSFSITRSGSGATNIITTTEFNTNNWNKVCFITDMDAGNIYSYVNGILDKTQARVMSGIMTMPPDPTIATDDTQTQWFNGGLDEICYIKGTDINITNVVSSYQSGSCLIGQPQNRTLNINVTIPYFNTSSLSSSIHLNTEYQWTGTTQNIVIQIYNFTSNSFQDLPDNLTYSATDTTKLITLTGNISNYVNASGSMILKYYKLPTINGEINTLSIDYIAILSNEYLDYPIQVIRGGGELNVRDYNFNLINSLWTLLNNVWTFITNDLWNINININTTVTQIKNDTTNIIQKIDNLTESVNANFTTVFQNQQTMLNYLQEINQTTHDTQQPMLTIN